MVDAESMTRRLLSLHEAVQHLMTHARGADAVRLRTEPMLRAAVERWLQIAVEACIDLAYHVIAEHGWTPPDTARASFAVLAGQGLVPAELAERLGRVVGMRDILVHEYAAVDLDVVTAVLAHGLGDLQAFGAIIGGLLEAGWES